MAEIWETLQNQNMWQEEMSGQKIRGLEMKLKIKNCDSIFYSKD